MSQRTVFSALRLVILYEFLILFWPPPALDSSIYP